ncbi:pleiotropic drug resistance protein 3-like [Gossypium australe]|uniref:Pleiotropic drug resistance protein 3-like n=1 Tax=Gossypium australe TaxID=47621 RepID=A0A5B6WYT4_9ROSI|nr:pleiotropic drug resistance protein 3-like [Gossypium australe]
MSSGSFMPPLPLIFASENYHIWRATPLRANPTIVEIRQHSDESAKKYKALSCLQNGASDVIFTRIMACETPKQAWDKLK